MEKKKRHILKYKTLLMLCIMSSIKQRDHLLQDLIKEAKTYPKGWKATIGTDPFHHSQDYYVYHPRVGLYALKEFEKNPYRREGVGGKIARKLDDDIDDMLAQSKGKFGIIQGDFPLILKHLKQGHSPHHILQQGLQGHDMGIRVPLQGHASTDASTFTTLRQAMKEKQKKLDTSFQDLLDKDGMTSSYG